MHANATRSARTSMSSPPPTGCCFLCQRPAESDCAECHRVFYCSPDHLQVHRGLRGDTCRPFRIERSVDKGNIMVAVRDIAETEVILEEGPATSGPKNKTGPVCLECLRTVKDGSRCSRCGFPACNQDCASGPLHSVECPIFARMDPKPSGFEEPRPEYSAIIPLRLLSVRQLDRDLWQRIQLLSDHIQDMTEEEKEMWKDVSVKVIRGRCGWLEYTEDEILRAVGIFLTNGVNQGTFNSQGLYPTFSFISHSCVCNSRYQIHGGHGGSDRRMVIRAQQNIKEGQEITTRYVPALMGSLRRRFKIRHNWNFDCMCERCADKTELGTFNGATLCTHCSKENGLNPQLVVGDRSAIPVMLPEDPLEYFGDHACSSCGRKVDGLTLFALHKSLEEEADKLMISEDGDLGEAKQEETLLAWQRALHPHHYLIVKLKKRLLDLLLLNGEPPEEDLRLVRWSKIVSLAKDLLFVVERLEPGLSLSRGRLLAQMHLPRLRLAAARLQLGRAPKEEFLEEARAAIADMKLAYRCLEDFGEQKDEDSSAIF